MKIQKPEPSKRTIKRHHVFAELELCHGDLDRTISKTGYTRRFVEFWVNRYRQTGNVIGKNRSGRPPILEAPQKIALAKAVEKADSVPAALANLQDKGIITRSISTKTAYRAVAAQLKQVLPQAQPPLTPSTKQKRIKFSKGRHAVMRCVAIDSSIVRAGAPTTRHKVWAWPGLRPVLPKLKQGQQLHVYAGITRYGATPLFLATGTTGLKKSYCKAGTTEFCRGVGAQEFQDIMQHHLVPAAERILRERGAGKPVFIIDGAPAHRAKGTLAFLRRRKIKYLHNWPPNSSDLNPIENAWGWWKRCVHKHACSTAAALLQCARQEWAQLTPGMCANLMGSFNKRKQLCVQRGGEHVGY
jgi:transposase